MPPKEKLTKTDIEVLEHWIRDGAPWPEVKQTAATTASPSARDHIGDAWNDSRNPRNLQSSGGEHETAPFLWRHHKRLHKKILIAHARTIIRAAGKTTVKVKLTKQGSQLLKHSKRLKVTDKTTFTPTGGKPTTRTSTFTLRRR